MVIKINKQKLIMEEVEQFDNISIEDLAEGASPRASYALYSTLMHLRILVCPCRVAGERAAICAAVARAEPR